MPGSSWRVRYGLAGHGRSRTGWRTVRGCALCLSASLPCDCCYSLWVCGALSRPSREPQYPQIEFSLCTYTFNTFTRFPRRLSSSPRDSELRRAKDSLVSLLKWSLARWGRWSPVRALLQCHVSHPPPLVVAGHDLILFLLSATIVRSRPNLTNLHQR